jgi:hypothetical protein
VLRVLDRIGGAMFVAGWPLSAFGLYSAGATLFPDSLGTVAPVAAGWFLALPWVVGLWLA